MKENEVSDKKESQAKIISISKEENPTSINDSSLVDTMMNALTEIEMKIDQHLDSNKK